MTTRVLRIDVYIARSAPFAQPMKKNAATKRAVGASAPSHCRYYVEWITEAKRPGTRARRLTQTIGQLAEGKTLRWKYASR